jgi:hypothetical protein
MRHYKPALRQLILEFTLHLDEGLGKEGVHVAEHPVAAAVTPVGAEEALDAPQPVDRVQETLEILVRAFLYLALCLHIHAVMQIVIDT